MKYMGSKAALLEGELGDILLRESIRANRFVDLFAGSAAVSHFMAQATALPVLSVDLQEYARVLAAAVIERTTSLAEDSTLRAWMATSAVGEVWDQENLPLTATRVEAARTAALAADSGFIGRHYGGHYFSPTQAHVLDALYRALPEDNPARTVALAALLRAASVCAAAPGHTAQPFQPTESLLPYIEQAWSRNVESAVRVAVTQIAPVFAQTAGEARTADAQTVISDLTDGDLVFCDPPYSAVQYSRFYHVLEGLAQGGWNEVTGKGRAPAVAARKSSEFSLKSKARTAMMSLLDGLYAQKCRVVITFPNANASNGLSGQDIIAMAAERWTVEPYYVDSVHSTLGGANDGGARGGRKLLKEAVIVLAPKPVLDSVPIVLKTPSVRVACQRLRSEAARV